MKVETGGEIFVLLLLTIDLVVHCAPLELKLIKSKSLFESDHEIARKLSDIASLFANERQYRDSFNLTEMSLVGYMEERYFSNIYFGEPKQELLLMFDTTSPMTWVASTRCSIFHCRCSTRRLYNRKLSLTFRADGRRFVLGSGNTKVTGTFSRENIDLAGWEIHNRSFGEVDSIGKAVVSNAFRWDGIFGLGLDHDVQQYSKSFMHELYDRHKDFPPYTEPIFSFYFFKRENGGSPVEGVFGFGTTDHTKYTGSIQYVNTRSAFQYWIVKMTSLDFEGINICEDCEGLLHTNFEYISAPQDKIARIEQYLNVTKFADISYVPCSTVSTLPSIYVKFLDSEFELKGSDYVFKHFLNPYKYCSPYFKHFPAEFKDYDGWVLGLGFLTNFYTVYDFDKKRVGFATPAEEKRDVLKIATNSMS